MLGRWAICEACFCTRCEKEKKGYSSCEDCEGSNDYKIEQVFDLFAAQHEQNEGYESD